MRAENPDFRFSGNAWEDLTETLKEANRQLHHHAVMKLEDLGLHWLDVDRALPTIDDGFKRRIGEIERRLDYGALAAGPWNPDWLRPASPTTQACPSEEEQEMARRIRDTAMAEHDRWTIERALDGWCPTGPGEGRDNTRRLHPNMHSWALLDAMTRRWDTVLLRGLIEHGTRHGHGPSARKAVTARFVLASGKDMERTRFIAPHLVAIDDIADGGAVTELVVRVIGTWPGLLARKHATEARRQFQALLDMPAVAPSLCRVRFQFADPPVGSDLDFVNQLADMAKGRGADILTDWLWTINDPPTRTVAFVGHRDLGSRVFVNFPSPEKGREALLTGLYRTFARTVVDGGVRRLVTGLAPGADRLAVQAWAGLGLPKPSLVAPFCDEGCWYSDDPECARAEDRVPMARAAAWGDVTLRRGHAGEPPHVAQATDLLREADLLVALWDGRTGNGPGSVADTLGRAGAYGVKVTEIAVRGLLDRDVTAPAHHLMGSLPDRHL